MTHGAEADPTFPTDTKKGASRRTRPFSITLSGDQKLTLIEPEIARGEPI